MYQKEFCAQRFSKLFTFAKVHTREKNKQKNSKKQVHKECSQAHK